MDGAEEVERRSRLGRDLDSHASVRAGLLDRDAVSLLVDENALPAAPHGDDFDRVA